MNRYSVDCLPGQRILMEEDRRGAYVLHSQAEAEISALREAVKKAAEILQKVGEDMERLRESGDTGKYEKQPLEYEIEEIVSAIDKLTGKAEVK